MQRNRIIYFNSVGVQSVRISSNSLLQTVGNGAVGAAQLADSPSKTSVEAAGVLAAACAEGRESQNSSGCWVASVHKLSLAVCWRSARARTFFPPRLRFRLRSRLLAQRGSSAVCEKKQNENESYRHSI